MELEYDQAKQAETLKKRGLDFNDAVYVFADDYLQREDVRTDYGETRLVVLGRLDRRIVVIVWTPRGEMRRIISMRYASDEEREVYRRELERSG